MLVVWVSFVLLLTLICLVYFACGLRICEFCLFDLTDRDLVLVRLRCSVVVNWCLMLIWLLFLFVVWLRMICYLLCFTCYLVVLGWLCLLCCLWWLLLLVLCWLFTWIYCFCLWVSGCFVYMFLLFYCFDFLLVVCYCLLVFVGICLLGVCLLWLCCLLFVC